MTIINPNSIAGITSVTAEAGVMNFYKSDGTLAGLQLNGVNFNTTSGISTFNNVYVGGTITYEDVKNVDSVGVVTARAGVNISGGNLQVGGTNVINSSRALYNVESVKLADSKNLILGTGDDLKIYHSGSHSFISEEGQGALKVKGDDVRFENASATEALRIDSGGRIGIKNTSPSSQYFNNLVVGDNSSGDWGITIRTNSSNKGVIAFSDTDSADANRYDGYIAYHHNGQSMRFHTGGANERLRILSNGKVVVGDTNSDAQFGVYRASYNLAEFTNTNADATGAEIYLRKDSSSPADNDSLGLINFVGDNDAGEKITYAYIQSKSTDVSDSTEDGDLYFHTRGAGTLTERLRIDSSGRLLIGTTTEGLGTYGEDLTIGSSDHAGITLRTGTGHKGTIYFSDGTSGAAEYKGSVQYDHSDDSLRFASSGAERFRIDSTGRVLIGTTSNRTLNSHTPGLQVTGTNYSQATVSIINNEANSNGAYLFFGKQRSGAVGGSTVVQQNDRVGQIRFSAGDGTDMESRVALIEAFVSGPPGGNDTPGRLTFSTTPDGSDNPVERLRIDSVGVLYTGNYSTTLDATPGSVQINGGTSGGRLGFRGATTSAGGGLGEIHGYWDTNKVASILFHAGDDTSNKDDGRISMYTSASGPSGVERFRITNTGKILTNLGSGNADTFEIQGHASQGRTILNVKAGNADGNSSTSMRLTRSNGNQPLQLFIGHNSDNGNIMNAVQGGHLIFHTNQSGSSVEKVRISSTGMVSIGTNNQSSGNANAKLRVGTESGSTNGYAIFGSGDTTIPAIYVTNWDGSQAQNNSVVAFDNSGWGRFDIGCVGGVDAFCIWDDGTQRLRITSDGTVIFKQGSTLTNTLQAYSAEGGYVHHYVARTTSGSDRYRRMLDVAGMGDSTHGGAIRFLTNSDGTANATERMRILPGNGIMVIGNNATITHNQNHIHRDCPGIFTVHSGSGESNRTNTSNGVYAAPTGGFVNYADYELAVKLIDISNSSVNIVMAKNGEPISIDQNRSSWSFYNKLPNYLLGLPCTDCINNTDFTLTLYADFLVFLLRNNGWNSIGTGVDNFPTGWREIEANTNIGPPGANTRLYCKSVSAGTYNNWDNNSAMYFFRLA